MSQAIARLRAEGRFVSKLEMTRWGEAPPPAAKTVTEQRWAIRHREEPDQFWTVAANWAPWECGTLHRARRERAEAELRRTTEHDPIFPGEMVPAMTTYRIG